MKNLILAAFIAALSTCNLADQYSSASQEVQRVQSERVSVRPEDLPEAIKSALASDGYADWKVASAFMVTRDNNTKYYEINVKRGEETATLNLDKYGKKVD